MKNVHTMCLFNLGRCLKIFKANATALLVMIVFCNCEGFRGQIDLEPLEYLLFYFFYSFLTTLLSDLQTDWSAPNAYQSFKPQNDDTDAA